MNINMQNAGKILSSSYQDLKFQGQIDRNRLDDNLINFTQTAPEDGLGEIDPLHYLVSEDMPGSFWVPNRTLDTRRTSLGNTNPYDPGRPL